MFLQTLVKGHYSYFAASNSTIYRLVFTWGAPFRKIQEVQRVFSKPTCIWGFYGPVPLDKGRSQTARWESIWEERAEGGTSKEPEVQLKNKQWTGHIWGMPEDLHGPGQDYLKFAVAQKAIALCPQTNKQMSKQGIVPLCSQQCHHCHCVLFIFFKH